jgi:3-oxoacyl-[acyl-carrier protein] reductase
MASSNTLSPRRALVMGGSRGIGAAIVRRLAADGAHVAFTYSSSPDAAQALVAEIEAQGGRAFALRADSASVAEVRGAVDAAAARLGGLDVLVNNAGILVQGSVADYSEADFERMVAINVRSVFFAVQRALRYLQRGGRVINIGSNAAVRVGHAESSVYTLTKSAVTAMTRGLARDLGPLGITVNAVQPGPTATDMTPGEGPLADYLKTLVPLGRLADPSEVADFVAYLANGNASFIHGAGLTMDGGMST